MKKCHLVTRYFSDFVFQVRQLFTLLPPISVDKQVHNIGNSLLCCVCFGVLSKKATVRKNRTVQEKDQFAN